MLISLSLLLKVILSRGEAYETKLLLTRLKTLTNHHLIHSHTLLNRAECHSTTLGRPKKNAVQWAIRGLAGAQGALSSHSSIKVGSRTNIVFTLERSVKAGFQSECCRVGQGSAQTGGVICVPLGKDLKSFRLVSSAIKQR